MYLRWKLVEKEASELKKLIQVHIINMQDFSVPTQKITFRRCIRIYEAVVEMLSER